MLPWKYDELVAHFAPFPGQHGRSQIGISLIPTVQIPQISSDRRFELLFTF
jgi:hypothetical protein